MNAVRFSAGARTHGGGVEPGNDIVRFRNVGMRYDVGPEVLRDISFRITAGSFHFLTGPSGAGKSSLLRLMYLANAPSRGEVTLFGRETVRLPRREIAAFRRRIGVVFQDFRLLDRLSARANVALPLRIAGSRGPEADERVIDLIRWVGLGGHADVLPAQLSGGQRQRIAIARALITRPDLVLADEPTASVDDRVGMRILHLLEEMHREGTTIVVATHNRGLVSRFNHPQIRIEDGTLVEGGDP